MLFLFIVDEGVNDSNFFVTNSKTLCKIIEDPIELCEFLTLYNKEKKLFESTISNKEILMENQQSVNQSLENSNNQNNSFLLDLSINNLVNLEAQNYVSDVQDVSVVEENLYDSIDKCIVFLKIFLLKNKSSK